MYLRKKVGRFGFILGINNIYELFSLLHIPCDDRRILQGISNDSRVVCKDWLFVSEKQAYETQMQYIEEALVKGAVVLCDIPIVKEHVYVCKKLSTIQQVLLELFYGELSKGIILIGITGTNGKTSVAGMITQLLRFHQKKVLRIGTHQVDIDGQRSTIRNTTPDAFALANLIHQAKQQAISCVVMEVSSHAVDQNRIACLQFNYLIYTGIQQDHLDYHLTSLHYRYTKYKLRRYLKEDGKIILLSNTTYYQEFQILLKKEKYVTIGTNQTDDFIITSTMFEAHKSIFIMNGKQFVSPLLGSWNIENLAQALVCCFMMGISFYELQNYVQRLKPEPGRMEVLVVKDFYIWIDYAHTASALQQILAFANTVKKHRIFCVFGCGGNRDRKKRAIMTNIACADSDFVVLTADNPRNEQVYEIILDMIEGGNGVYEIFENRAYAIKHCLNIAKKNDIIIIAGKGNEHTQEVQGIQYPFLDKQCVWDILHEEEINWK